MTVGELMQAIRDFPVDTPVFIDYVDEDGEYEYEELTAVTLAKDNDGEFVALSPESVVIA